MTLSQFPHGVASFGIPVLSSGGVPAMFGNYWFVDFTNGDDTYGGKNSDEPFKTLTKAYAECTSGNNDVIVINGTDPPELDTMLTWSKNKIHVVGLGGFGATDQSPRIIFSTVGKASDSAAVLKVTGWANTFTNLRINSWGTHTNNVTALWDAGEATVYTNCQFNMFENLGDTTSHNVEARGDSTTWRNCKFGFDTLEVTAARPTMLIKGTGGSARMKNNYFENCYWVCNSSDSDGAHILISSTSSLAFGNVIKNPIFYCTVVSSMGTAVLDNAIDSVASLVEGNILVVNPSTNCTAVCATVTDRVQVVGPDTHATAGAPNTPS